MAQKHAGAYWVVVKVESGIPAMASLFLDETEARKQEQILRAEMNLEDDETGIFEVSIAYPLTAEPDLSI